MQRIKYEKTNLGLKSIVYDIYARKITVYILKGSTLNCKIKRAQISDYTIDEKVICFEIESLQNAKRKVRKILKDLFEVNLQDEVRNKLCI